MQPACSAIAPAAHLVTSGVFAWLQREEAGAGPPLHAPAFLPRGCALHWALGTWVPHPSNVLNCTLASAFAHHRSIAVQTPLRPITPDSQAISQQQVIRNNSEAAQLVPEALRGAGRGQRPPWARSSGRSPGHPRRRSLPVRCCSLGSPCPIAIPSTASLPTLLRPPHPAATLPHVQGRRSGTTR